MNAKAQYLEVQKSAQPDYVSLHAELVKRIAYHLAARLPRSVEVQDLIQAGMIGLIEAARQFDDSVGASFETYASIRIRGSMIDELRRSDWVPRSVHRKTRELTGALREIEQRTARPAQASEVAAALNISVDEYHKTLDDAVRCQMLSLDFESEDGESSRYDVAGDDDQPDQAQVRDQFQVALAEAIVNLPERERLIMAMYYQEELNLREIGEVLGVTESRVCQLHGQALVRLRARLGEWIGDAQLA